MTTQNNNIPNFASVNQVFQLKRIAENNGSKWFSPDNMRFSGSRIHDTCYGGCVFVSSEYTGFSREGRAYTVRVMMDDGSITNWGGFLSYSTRYEAHKEAAWLGRAIKAGKIRWADNGYELEAIETEELI